MGNQESLYGDDPPLVDEELHSEEDEGIVYDT